jgi:hypothetical protein
MRRLSGADALMVRLDDGNAHNHTLKITVRAWGVRALSGSEAP